MTALLAPAATERWAVFPVALGRLGTNVTLKPSPRPCSAPPGAAWASRRHELTLGGLRSRQRTTVPSATSESLLLHQILDLDRSFAGPASSNILEATAGPALRQRAAACLPAVPMSPHFRNLSRPQVRRHGDRGHRVQGQGPRHGARRKLSRDPSDPSATYDGGPHGELPTTPTAGTISSLSATPHTIVASGH